MMDYAGRVAQADTYPKLLRLNAKEHGREIALREKDLGLWRIFTWDDYQNRVRDFALGMIELGIGRGDVIGIIGDNRPDWVSAEIAAHAVGGMSLGMYRESLSEEVLYLLSYGETKLVFAEDEEQVDKLLELGDRAPHLCHIVYSDPRGMRKYDDPRLISADRLAEMGRERAARDPDLYDQLVDATNGEDVAILCTTSGTTSNPKLAMLAAGRVLRHCATYLSFDPKGPDDEYVSVLPLPWIMEQVYALGKGLLSRMKVNFVEQPDTMMNDFREIAPTFVLFAPRIWEAIAADVRSRVMDSSPMKQRLYDVGMKSGLAALDKGERSMVAETLLFVPCVTDWASRGCAPRQPAARRLGRIRSSSSGRWVCLFGHSMARPKHWAHLPCTSRMRSIPTPRACRWPKPSRSRSESRMPTVSAKSSSATPTCSSVTTRMKPRLSRICATDGCTPAMPVTSTHRNSLSSSIASRTLHRRPAAIGSHRNTSRIN